MSLAFDKRIAPVGTRFRIFPIPRYAGTASFTEPEVVTVSIPVGSVSAGPSDNRMYVVDATSKQPYSEFTGPPYLGAAGAKVQPGLEGHFDHIPATDRSFLLCTMYATVRRVLDIWEDYFGDTIPWHFSADFDRLELIPLINWDNAQSGYGFLEFGYGRRPSGGLDFTKPYCENFDVLAHELGHSIIFSQVGVPGNANGNTDDYGGFHESAGDLVALVALLHFNSVVEHLLDQSKGNLFTINELNRIGELSASREIRRAFNYKRMSDVGAEPHDRSEPLTGAFFDIFVEFYQRRLVEANLISVALAEASLGPRGESPESDQLQAEFETAYSANTIGFKLALLEARDDFGKLLARIWSNLSPNNLTYGAIARLTLTQDSNLFGGKHHPAIRSSFQWRQITVPQASPLRAIRRVSERMVHHDESYKPDDSVRGPLKPHAKAQP